MPGKLLRPCSVPGCQGFAAPGASRCEQHHRQVRREQDARRGSAASRGYGARWRKLRALVLAREPLCRACAAEGRVTPATDVDHIVPRSRGGKDTLSNLQPLCHMHHSRKTASEDGGFGNKG